MALPNLKQALKGAVMGAAAAGMTLAPSVSFPAAANAQSASAQNVAYSHANAAIQASNYSKQRGQIGFVVSYGPNSGMPAEQLVQVFENEFAKRNVRAKGFIAPSNTPGAALAFNIQEVGYGPWSPSRAAANLNDLVSKRKMVDGLLASNSYQPSNR